MLFQKTITVFAVILLSACTPDKVTENNVGSSKVNSEPVQETPKEKTLSAKQKNIINSLVMDDLDVAKDGGDALLLDDIQKVTSIHLSKEYQDNEVMGDEKYRDKNIVVTSKVLGIKKDATDTPYVELQGSDIFSSPLAYFGEKETTSTIATLKKGEKITLVCTPKGLVLGSVILKKCERIETYYEKLQNKLLKDITDILNSKSTKATHLNKKLATLVIILDSEIQDSSCEKDEKECIEAVRKTVSDKSKITAEKFEIISKQYGIDLKDD